MRCNVFIYSDGVTLRDESRAEKRFQHVQSRVQRVVATRVTCIVMGEIREKDKCGDYDQ